MLCLHYQDDQERIRAVAAIARRCRRFQAPLLFLGPEVACASVRGGLSELDATTASRVTFQSLRLEPDRPDHPGTEALEALPAALLEVSAAGLDCGVVWLEAPVIPDDAGTAKAIRSYHDALDALVADSPATVISAFRFADVPERGLLDLLAGATLLLSAKSILPQCSSSLLFWNDALVWPVSGPALDSGSGAADHTLTSRLQTEKLAALGQLTAGFAHELGNPLSIISSSLQYLHQRLAASQDSASDFTMTALQSVDRMHGLLRRMLDFAGIRKPIREQVDLKEVVSEILRFTSAECVRRGILVELSFDASLPSLRVDPGGVKQILLNLVKNALDALSLSGDTLRVRTRLRPTERLAAVEVENNGPSIPAETLASLFRPFHTTKRGGTGLGLYLSRQIAKDHGGDLRAENHPGAVRFTLTLPLVRPDEEEPWRGS